MDFYAAHPLRVEPLPRHSLLSYPYQPARTIPPTPIINDINWTTHPQRSIGCRSICAIIYSPK